jgi:phosphopantetheine adenylyltransferase
LRKTIKYKSKPLDPELSFLGGKLLKDLNKSRIYTQVRAKYLQLKKESEHLQNKLEDINRRSNRGRNLNPDEYRGYQELRNRAYSKQRSLERYLRIFKDLEEENRFYTTNMLMQTEPETFFIIHRTNIEKDARLIISKLLLAGEKNLKELWRTTIEDLFYDYNSARETSDFKIVFSKGNPRFDFQFFDYSEDKFVFIYMLHACCLDLESGQVLWKFRL